MKIKLLTIVVGAAMFGLTGCNDKGSDHQVVAIPGLPQGRVNSFNDPNNYCDVSQEQKTVTCGTTSVNRWGNAQTCLAPTIQFNDLQSLCLNLSNALNSTLNLNSQCGRTGMAYLYSQTCNGVGQNVNPPTTIPGIPSQPGIPTQPAKRIVRCDFEAVRSRGQLLQVLSRSASSAVLFEGSSSHTFSGTSDRFGKVTVSYDKASDLVTIKASGVNRDTNVTQSGYAGQDVRLNINNEDDSVRVGVACRDAAPRTVTNPFVSYACKGTSNLNGRNEKVDTTISADELLDDEVTLATGLTLNAQGLSGLNSSLVTLKASGVSLANSAVLSSAYSNAVLQMKVNDGVHLVDVSCRPKR